jgi:hypothetical protein
MASQLSSELLASSLVPIVSVFTAAIFESALAFPSSDGEYCYPRHLPDIFGPTFGIEERSWDKPLLLFVSSWQI